MVFGHLEVLHAKFHDRTISNLGDYVAQTNRQTDRQTNRQTDRQCNIYSRYMYDVLNITFYKLCNMYRMSKKTTVAGVLMLIMKRYTVLGHHVWQYQGFVSIYCYSTISSLASIGQHFIIVVPASETGDGWVG